MAVVVIDPGHGGATKVGGSSANNATSPSGLLEKDLTLAVARHAETALVERGHRVRMTRTTDVNLGLADRAAVARTAKANAFISVHFNGFGDPAVQGTETWVHTNASSRSRDLASCVQRSVLRATGHRDRGVQAKVLGALDPAHHAALTAACLAELSFITTSAEDKRLHDPAYLRALGEAVAAGVEEFLAQPVTASVSRTAEAAPRPRVIADSTATPLAATTATTAIDARNPILADVRAALDGVSTKAGKSKLAGKVKSDGDADSHLQGLAGYKDFFLLTHSDKSEQSGRILIVDRRPTVRKLVAEFRLPPLHAAGPPLNHAGGCQMIGDVLAVPCESGSNSSVVAFFDVRNPLSISELSASLRIPRNDRDAGAVGITTITRGGQEAWLCAVYDSGSVDLYESPDLPGGAPFRPVFQAPLKVKEKDHQALLLFTDVSNRVFAAGLNRGNFPFFDRLVLYEVDLVGQSMRPDPERSYSTGGGARLRWGSTLEFIRDGLALHCTSRNYGSGCELATFPTTALAAGATTAAQPGRHRGSQVRGRKRAPANSSRKRKRSASPGRQKQAK